MPTGGKAPVETGSRRQFSDGTLRCHAASFPDILRELTDAPYPAYCAGPPRVEG